MSEKRRASEFYVLVPGGKRVHLSDLEKGDIDSLVDFTPREGWLFARSLSRVVENLLEEHCRERIANASEGLGEDSIPEFVLADKQLQIYFHKIQRIRDGFWADLRGFGPQLRRIADELDAVEPDGLLAEAAIRAATAEVEMRQLMNGEIPET